jgi:outer membrane protein assembly factor BamD
MAFFAWTAGGARRLRVALGLLVAGIVVGCSSTKIDNTADWSPNRLHAEAKSEMNAGAWQRAIPLLEKLEGRAAGTILAQQAQLDRAYAHHRNNEPGLAIATVDRFMRLHPTSPALDYALYLKGIVNFNEDLGMFGFLSRQDLSERDQKAAKESFDALRELAERFPDSRYTPDARQRMVYILNSLANYEVHVARYYYSRGAYVAAINRAQVALQDYREVPALEEALYILMRSYDALGMTQLRDDAKRVLERNYPNSTFVSQGFQRAKEPWWKLW